MATLLLEEYTARVAATLKELAIPTALIAQRALEICCEPQELEVAEIEADGKEHLLNPAAAEAWRRMSEAASADGVVLHIASAFRNVERQAEIIRRKLERGLSLEQILCVSAPPGYSEHHSGSAVDVCTPGCPPLEPEFERTEAFGWLSEHAGRYGFTLSFSHGNRYGYAYEPWHWCFRGTTV
jgi:D-alanyl-D-alanine carboxypeptidase